MLIQTKLHTIFLLVGPTLAGKSTFADALAQRLILAHPELRATVLSSDAIRRELLGGTAHDRHDRAMTEVSKVAFEQLFSRLRALTTWPVNHEFIIVDTTGLDEAFRAEVITLAHNTAYNVEAVLFDFPHSHYFQAAAAHQTATLLKQVKRFKAEVLPRIRKKDFNEVHRLKSRDVEHWASLRIEVSDLVEWDAARVSVGDKPLALIGDVHEAVGAAKALLKDLGDVRPVLVGDWMDKGGDTVGAIELAESIVAQGGLLIMGNHESYLRNRLTGALKDHAPPEVEETYFTALAALTGNEELTQRFIALTEQALPYLHIRAQGQRTGAYVTHAPVMQKFIGKHSSVAKREQRNFRLPAKTSEDAREALAPIMAEAGGGLPLHVWGHVPHSGPVFFKNQARIDTGAIQGGKLTALVFPPNEGRPYVVQTEGAAVHEGTIYALEAPLDEPTQARVDPEERRIIEKMLNAGIRYLSGTMAPAASTAEQLEPMSTALDALRKSGAVDVILEPKYMGSRAQVYLFRDAPEKSFAVSRNGYVMRQAELSPVWQAAYARFAQMDFWKETLILDGELLPWHAAGAGLIERDFKQYRAAVAAEFSALAKDEVFASFAIGKEIDAEGQLAALEVYDRQLEIYARPGEPHFKAFTVLAADGESWVERDQAKVFDLVAEGEPKLVLNLEDESALAQAEAFFATLTVEHQMEGVVVKPRHFKDGMLPYIKVRNEDYLTIIYGHNYKQRYAKMCAGKKVLKKMALSRKEFALANRLLTEQDFETQVQLMANLRNEIAQETTLDPRL